MARGGGGQKRGRPHVGDETCLGRYSSSEEEEDSPVGGKRQRGEEPAPAAAAGSEPAYAAQKPRAASDFSALELLPDELLKRVIGFLGLREAWQVCRLPLVSRRMRDALASIEFDALVLRGQRGGVSRYRDVPEAELRSWALRAQSSALRLAAGGALEVDLWRPPFYEVGSVAGADSIQPSFWMPEPARPFLSFASSLQGLRRFVAWHGDVVAREERSAAASAKARHAYVGALLAALAPVAGTLEELSVRLQTAEVNDRHRLPLASSPGGCAITEGLRRLTALRSLDLADCIGFSADLLEQVAPALGGLRSLRIAHHFFPVMSLYQLPNQEKVKSFQRSFASAIRSLCPNLEELRVTFSSFPSNCSRNTNAAALAPLCSLPCLRVFGLKASGLSSLPQFTSAHLESLEFDARSGYSNTFLHDAARTSSVRDLALAGFGQALAVDFLNAEKCAPLRSQLRSLSLGPTSGANDRPSKYDPPPEHLSRLPSFAALESLSLRLSSPFPHHLTAAADALAQALPSMPSLRSLRLGISSSAPNVDTFLSVAVSITFLLHVAKDILEEYDQDGLPMYPSVRQGEALAACARLRRAALTLAEPARLWASDFSDALAALGPLADMAADPAPAPGDLVLARREGDESDWGALRQLLGDRWRLE
eukprot:tig00020825_g14293.t1